MSVKDLSDCLKIKCELDKLEGYLVVQPGYDPSQMTAEIVTIQVKAADVAPRWIDYAAIDDLVERCLNEPDRTHHALIAKGTAPTHGINGTIVLDAAIRQRKNEIEHRQVTLDAMVGRDEISDQDQKVTDFRSQSSFILVRKGQAIAKLTHPTEGFDGEDIYGATIPARRGAPCTISLGQGVGTDSDNIVRALTSGVLHASPIEIRVSETLDIPGAVDFTTGNIHFTGDITVAREVQDCFVVETAGSLKVRGLVQAATIRTGRKLELPGGMAGREKGEFFAGGGLSARYLDGVNGVVRGSCEIRNEINSCDLTIHGRLESPDAAMRGGKCLATKGVCIGILGGQGGIQTRILIGHLPEPEALISRIDELTKVLEGAAADADARLDQHKRSMSKKIASQEEELTKLEVEARTQAKRLESLRHKTAELSDLVAELTHYSVRVIKRACPGVTIWFPGYRVEIRDEIKGPFDLILDPAHGIQLIDVNSGAKRTSKGLLRIVEDLTVVPLPRRASVQSAA